MDVFIKKELEISPDDLELVEQVGQGAYGHVWKGKWKGRGGGAIVAIKKIEVLVHQDISKLLVEVCIL